MEFALRHLLSYAEPSALAWVFALSVLVAFVMGFATGANDVANTFGTSVGSGALTMRNALIVAGICEMLGAVSLGSRVADTIQKGIADPLCFAGDEGLLMAGMLASLCAAGGWLLFASAFGLPVSTTHSIVGSVIGWVASPALSGIVAFMLYFIILKGVVHAQNPVRNTFWALPLLSAGTMAFLLALILKHALEDKLETWQLALIILAVALVVGLATHFIFVPWLKRNIANYTSPDAFASMPMEKNDNEAIPLEEMNTGEHSHSSEGSLVKSEDSAEGPAKERSPDGEYSNGHDPDAPHVESVTEKLVPDGINEELVSIELKGSAAIVEGGAEEAGPVDELYLERQKARKLFYHIQLFSASLGAFAHGANDTASPPPLQGCLSILTGFVAAISDAIGPFAAIFFLWQGMANWTSMEVPIWMVAMGGLSIVAGLSLLGHRVIKTMGTDITHVDFVNGFITELSSGMTVVLASALKVPVSSTHCQVGAIVGVGLVPDKDKKVAGVNWRLFGKIFGSWIITLPVSGLVAALIAWLLGLAIKV